MASYGFELRPSRKVIPEQTIHEVWNGVGRTGPIPNSGGFMDKMSIGHDLSALGTGDIGGPFFCHKSVVYCGYGHAYKGAGTGSEVALHPPIRPVTPGLTEPDDTVMWALGGTAISRCAPDQTQFDVEDFLAESVSGGIPKAIGSSTWRDRAKTVLDVFKHGGNEYLNVVFGWQPLLHDVIDFCHTVAHANSFLHDLAKGSGKKTRTGYAFPASDSTATTNTGPFLYSVDSTKSGWSSGGKFTTSTWNHSEDWFKGCFRYVLPIPPSQMDANDKMKSYADHILGIGPRINPEVLWDAAPWSWAVDWAVNVGDVAHNINQFSRDSLVMQYGYFMSKRRTITQATFSGGAVSSGCSTVALSEFLKRVPASPYGFGLTYDGLSGTQKSILAAVGITHFG